LPLSQLALSVGSSISGQGKIDETAQVETLNTSIIVVGAIGSQPPATLPWERGDSCLVGLVLVYCVIKNWLIESFFKLLRG
jgi:hypothetical protein